MDEVTFINSIDCAFPYEDEQAWRSLIVQGAAISDNASFMVLHEICRAPREINSALQHKMIEVWKTNYSHPTSSVTINAGKAIIDNTNLPVETVLKYMEIIRCHPRLYNALAIVYFACDDINEIASEKYYEIINEWRDLQSV